MKRGFIYFVFFVLSSLSAFANESVQLVMRAPNMVANGQRFRLDISLKNGSSDNIQMPNLSGFEVIMGPSVSKGKSVTMINGQTTVSENISYTYVLIPKKEGTFTISPSKAIVNGKTVMSNAVTIKVLPEESNPTASNSRSNSDSGNSSSDVSVSDNDIFIRTEFSKTKVYEQEQIIATIKLYHRVNIRGFDEIKLPEFNGFVSQEIDVPDEQKYGGEVVNGKNYKTFVLRKLVLFPQKSGTIEIEKGKATAVVQVLVNRPQSRNIFDNFFSSYADVKKNLVIPSLVVNVMPLPENGKPADFNGAVGNFQLSSNITSDHVKANEAISVKMKISGSGNVKYIKNPVLNFPPDFEVYDPKVDTKTTATSAGVTGSKSIEYIAIPRSEGEFTIPATSFSYFDVKAKKYKTLTTPEYKLTVEKGAPSSTGGVIANYTDKENVKVLGKDIRFINTKNLTLNEKNNFLYGSLAFWLWFLIPLIIFIVLFIIYRKQVEENANLVLVKNKRANKQAIKRLKAAEQSMKAGNNSSFYEEVLKAMWGYISDKLNIPVAQLNKDNIESELVSHNVSNQLISEFMELLNTCEFARFAPSEGDGSTKLNSVYSQAMEIIGKLEQEVKK